MPRRQPPMDTLRWIDTRFGVCAGNRVRVWHNGCVPKCSSLQKCCLYSTFAVKDAVKFVNPHQRYRYSDSPFARIHYFYTARSRNGFQGVEAVCIHTKKTLILQKTYFFVIEKYIEDVRQDEKHVPDLLASIMRPTDPVKEELRPILSKMSQIRYKIKKIKVSTFWIPEIQSFPAGGQHNLLTQ